MEPGRALVTGAGARLGREMAVFLARRGWSVAVHYAASADGARETVEMCRAEGAKAVALQADLLEPDAVDGLVPRAVDALGGPLTLLVNNASIFEYDRLDTATAESWDRHIGSNLRAPFFLAQAFAAQAPEHTRCDSGEPRAAGLIVNMLDQRVWKPTPEFMTYTIAKMGLWAFTRTAAQALAPHVRVNAIGPGPTLVGSRQTDEHFARQRANTILRRGSDPDDITGALGYLIDAKAVTGQMIAVDGGQHLGWQTPDIIGLE